MSGIIFDKVLERNFSSLSLRIKPGNSGNRPNIGERARSGTTIIGFYYKDGIMLAADRKTTEGYLGIKSLRSIKIHQVDNFTGVLFAGWVGDIQYVLKRLVDTSKTFRSSYGYRLTINGQVNFLTDLFRVYMDYVRMLEVVVIIAGSDSKGELHLYEVALDGSKYKHDSYVAEGSGGSEADGVLYEARKMIRDRSLAFDEAIALAIKAIYKSGVKDSGSSDLRVAYPNVAIITPSDGFSFVAQDVVKREADKIIGQEGDKDV